MRYQREDFLRMETGNGAEKMGTSDSRYRIELIGKKNFFMKVGLQRGRVILWAMKQTGFEEKSSMELRMEATLMTSMLSA